MPHEVATRHFLRRRARVQAKRLNQYAKATIHYSVRKSSRGPYRWLVYRETDRVAPSSPLRPQFESREQRAARIKRITDQLQ